MELCSPLSRDSVKATLVPMRAPLRKQTDIAGKCGLATNLADHVWLEFEAGSNKRCIWWWSVFAGGWVSVSVANRSYTTIGKLFNICNMYISESGSRRDNLQEALWRLKRHNMDNEMASEAPARAEAAAGTNRVQTGLERQGDDVVSQTQAKSSAGKGSGTKSMRMSSTEHMESKKTKIRRMRPETSGVCTEGIAQESPSVRPPASRSRPSDSASESQRQTSTTEIDKPIQTSAAAETAEVVPVDVRARGDSVDLPSSHLLGHFGNVTFGIEDVSDGGIAGAAAEFKKNIQEEENEANHRDRPSQYPAVGVDAASASPKKATSMCAERLIEIMIQGLCDAIKTEQRKLGQKESGQMDAIPSDIAFQLLFGDETITKLDKHVVKGLIEDHDWNPDDFSIQEVSNSVAKLAEAYSSLRSGYTYMPPCGSNSSAVFCEKWTKPVALFKWLVTANSFGYEYCRLVWYCTATKDSYDYTRACVTGFDVPVKCAFSDHLTKNRGNECEYEDGTGILCLLLTHAKIDQGSTAHTAAQHDDLNTTYDECDDGDLIGVRSCIVVRDPRLIYPIGFARPIK